MNALLMMVEPFIHPHKGQLRLVIPISLLVRPLLIMEQYILTLLNPMLSVIFSFSIVQPQYLMVPCIFPQFQKIQHSKEFPVWDVRLTTMVPLDSHTSSIQSHSHPVLSSCAKPRIIMLNGGSTQTQPLGRPFSTIVSLTKTQLVGDQQTFSSTLTLLCLAMFLLMISSKHSEQAKLTEYGHLEMTQQTQPIGSKIVAIGIQ
jgi:hypothetical protein